ncbi:threonine aldolase [Polychaeton citri CBS 116435]|uniref:Threonine aldolase n=1 Tax=Polychaeton citri CBS 116435 TaxID=1314669 RepID=A0A9P4UQR6_9PEZI|nr:threonine aldolase [Polychaeton citri CBS 116435]
MSRYAFLDDYSEAAHPRILEALVQTNQPQQKPYGQDDYSNLAKECIRKEIALPTAAVHLVASGTLANIISIGSCLRPHEAVISTTMGHILVRETGAIEAIGHKIITVPTTDGKLTPQGIEEALDRNAQAPHMAKPRLLYISNATELGTVYTMVELKAISELCRKHGLLLFVDGARMGAALAAAKNDLRLADIARLADIFWIGGTKVGLLCGEAIVISNPTLADDFEYHVKQRGGLLAKGRVLGVQFLELFRENMFLELAQHANNMAQMLSAGIVKAGCTLAAETETNQVFARLPNPMIAKLQHRFEFYTWEKAVDDQSVVRLVTSWATVEQQVVAFIDELQSCV